MRACYAIGDVHGEDERLARLHDLIAEDIAREGGPALIVHLGDLIDRGADSRGVVERVMALERAAPAGAEARCVRGNHEQMMLDARGKASAAQQDLWLDQGGAETLASYERVNGAHADWPDSIDGAHVHWMRRLPTMICEGGFVFVHAGVDPQRFPGCSQEVRLWTRSAKFFDEGAWPVRAELADIVIVHGHTPTADFMPDISRRRINIDTGAVYGGPLTCAALMPESPPRFLYA